jgi:hypothetical protein
LVGLTLLPSADKYLRKIKTNEGEKYVLMSAELYADFLFDQMTVSRALINVQVSRVSIITHSEF